MSAEKRTNIIFGLACCGNVVKLIYLPLDKMQVRA